MDGLRVGRLGLRMPRDPSHQPGQPGIFSHTDSFALCVLVSDGRERIAEFPSHVFVRVSDWQFGIEATTIQKIS